MSPDLQSLRSNRAVVVSVVGAALAVTALALIGIASLLGWIGPRTPAGTGAKPPDMPAPAAPPRVQASNGIDLVPGETLVSAPEVPPARPEPLMPKYGMPTPIPGPPRPAKEETTPPPKPRADYWAATRPPERTERVVPTTPVPPPPIPEPPPEPPRIAARPVPSTPSFARGGPHPTSPANPWPNAAPCDECGTVTRISAYRDMWEVRVRFEDGTIRYVRYRNPPPFRLGDEVRFEGGRLLAD